MNRDNSNSPNRNPHDEAGSRGFAAEMFTHLRVSIVATIVLGVIVSGIYPAIVWGLAQALFHHQANGSLIKKDGSPTDNDSEAVGSALLGQPFSDVKYFHPRPSAAGNGYDPTASGGTNYGPLSDKLINGATNTATTQPTTQPESLAFDGVRLRTIHYAVDNGISFKLNSVRADGTGPKVEIPIKQFEDAQGNLNDVALVDAFPHPPTDTPDRMVVVAGDFSTAIPPDAVTASSSGLDPHVSVVNAELQAKRVADAQDFRG